MNIIIPIGGIGKRFSDDGFNLPKPLINVLGKPMIYHVIDSFRLERFAEHNLIIIYHNTLIKYNFETLLRFYFPKLNMRFICIDYMTKGAAETVLRGLDLFSDEELILPVLVADCDTFYEDDVVSLYSNSSNKSTIFYFEDTNSSPIFSYISIVDNKVTDIQEKLKISNNASTGLYGFKSAELLRKYCEKILNYNKELYLSCIYQEMLKDKLEINTQQIYNFSCVGTPVQLKSYCNKNKDRVSSLRFCFDLDNTLVTHPHVSGDYRTVEPIERNIEFLRMLKNLGSTIIIYTARRMRTHGGNVGAIVADIGKVTLETLEKFQVPYDEIYFGKPYANFYIDDLAINANSSLDMELGIYNLDILPRNFNDVFYDNNLVIKTTNNKGEIYWYEHIPLKCKHLFPEVLEIKNNTIKMARVDGVTFSHLYTSQHLTTVHLDKLFESLVLIHESVDSEEVDIYSNYSRKLLERLSRSEELYRRYDLLDVLKDISSRLRIYESENLGKLGVIHGDPVFTNIFETNTNLIFIDMRGKQGNKLTLFGDIYYDYGKIYQSLLGYDHILNGCEINHDYMLNMKIHFEKRFTKQELDNIKLITASLFISLLPLHTEEVSKFNKYKERIETLLY